MKSTSGNCICVVFLIVTLGAFGCSRRPPQEICLASHDALPLLIRLVGPARVTLGGPPARALGVIPGLGSVERQIQFMEQATNRGDLNEAQQAAQSALEAILEFTAGNTVCVPELSRISEFISSIQETCRQLDASSRLLLQSRIHGIDMHRMLCVALEAECGTHLAVLMKGWPPGSLPSAVEEKEVFLSHWLSLMSACYARDIRAIRALEKVVAERGRSYSTSVWVLPLPTALDSVF